MNIKLKCPCCKKDIAVACSPGLEQKSAECPNCHEKQKIGDFLPEYSLKVEGKNYQLHFGRQWVGRLKNGNDAEVQIPDETHYMSRKHAIIELSCLSTGIRCTFEEHGTNPTTISGIELIKDDIICLNIHDCLQLGDVKMFLANEFEDSAE